MSHLDFDEARHEYKVDGRAVLHVTSVLRSALGDQFARVPPDVLERKRQIGTAAHMARHLDDAGELDESTVHPDVMPYVDAWRAFRRELRFVVALSERRLYSKRLGLAGALDLFVLEVGFAWRGVIDLKTGIPGPLVGLQTAAYQALIEDAASDDDELAAIVRPIGQNGPIPWRRFAMQALPNGRYRLTEYTSPADLRDFLSCLNVARLKERLAA